MTDTQTRVIVVGGGASGLMAAGMAAKRGLQVMLLERNATVGRKLRISGKGRCNLTNETDVPGLEKQIPSNPKFLRPAFYRFTPKDTMAFFEALGVPLKTERGGRVFPESDNADDVICALEAFCGEAGVDIRTNTTVKHLLTEGGRVTGVTTEDGVSYMADAVILAAGGSSYPGTGSRGDGFRMAKEVGHAIVQPQPSLVPLETVESWPLEAQGLSLRNVAMTTFSPEGKKLRSELGEMIFTHFGVSGPLVLSASRQVAQRPGSTLVIDLKPGLDEETLDARIVRDFAERSNKQFVNALDALLPLSMIPIIVHLSGIPERIPVHQITREQRLKLAHLLKHLTVTVKKARPFSEAIVTMGGVSTKEIDPNTLESKRVPGLYFTGEVIDVDAYTGGFNLQIAWSTGALAGTHVAE